MSTKDNDASCAADDVNSKYDAPPPPKCWDIGLHERQKASEWQRICCVAFEKRTLVWFFFSGWENAKKANYDGCSKIISHRKQFGSRRHKNAFLCLVSCVECFRTVWLRPGEKQKVWGCDGLGTSARLFRVSKLPAGTCSACSHTKNYEQGKHGCSRPENIFFEQTRRVWRSVRTRITE